MAIVKLKSGREIEIDNYTQKQFDAESEKYGKRLKAMLVPLEEGSDEKKAILFVVPDIHQTSEYIKFKNVQPEKAWSILNTNCIVHGKEIVMLNDFTQITVAKHIETEIPLGTAEILN